MRDYHGGELPRMPEGSASSSQPMKKELADSTIEVVFEKTAARAAAFESFLPLFLPPM